MSASETISLNYTLLEARLGDLRDAYWEEPCVLRPGDLVRWKPGFTFGSQMGPEELAVVLAVPETPWIAEDLDPDSPEYRMAMDVELGLIDEMDEWILFRGSRRHLLPASEEEGRVAELLRHAFREFVDSVPLHPGELVVWKPFCAPTFLNRPEMPGIVVERLAGTQAGMLDLPSTARGACAPVDLAVAVEDELCGFRVLWTDARRMRRYEGAVARDPVSPEEEAELTLLPWAEVSEQASLVAARLLKRYTRLIELESRMPEPGGYVRWKAGLRDRVVPMDGDAAVVVQVYDRPIRDPVAPVGSPLWGQPLSVALGCMGEDGHFIVCPYDARRFEPLPSGKNAHRAFLEQAVAGYRRCWPFQAGDLVQWKFGLANRTLPGEGDPAIVVEVMDPSGAPEGLEASSPGFCDPLTLVVGVRDGEEFALLHVDGARLEPYSAATHPQEAEWLRQRSADLRQDRCWNPGDLVEWKEGFCPLHWIRPRDHGVVLEQFENPRFACGVTPDSSLYGMPYSVSVGFLDEDGNLLMHPVDGRRLQEAAPDPVQDDLLREIFTRYLQPEPVEVGDVVEWGEGLGGTGFLDFSEESPGIVLRRLDPPLQPEKTILFSADFGLCADLVVGGLDEEGEFLVIHADSRRLVPHRFQRGALARRLRGFQRRLGQPSRLRKGQLVAWKDCLSAHPALPYGIPAVLLDVQEKPCVYRPWKPASSLGSPTFAMPRDVVVGAWVGGRFLRLHCDGQRLEPFDVAIHGAILQRHASEEARRMEEFSRMLEDFDEDDPPF